MITSDICDLKSYYKMYLKATLLSDKALMTCLKEDERCW